MADIKQINVNNTTYDIRDASKAMKADTVLDTTLSRGRKANTTVGSMSFAFGNNVTASGSRSFAIGQTTTASGGESHSEGTGTTASGSNSHAEGGSTTASGTGSHAEGASTTASGNYSHAEGEGTTAAGTNSHAAGRYNVADSFSNVSEWVSGTSYSVGDKVKRTVDETITTYICKTANSDSSFTSSKWINANGEMHYAEIIGNGVYNVANSNARALDWDGNEYLAGDLYVGCSSDSTGGSKVAKASEIPDVSTKADKANPVFTGSLSKGRTPDSTIGLGSFAFGNYVVASGNFTHAEGNGTTASGSYSHSECYYTTASGDYSHAEGQSTIASGTNAHAEGKSVTAIGNQAHAEGNGTYAYGDNSHTEGLATYAYGANSHVGGKYNVSDTYVNWPAWAANTSYAVGDKVQRISGSTRVGYICKTAHTSGSTFSGTYWTSDTCMNFAEIIGNGTSTSARSNARTLDWDGNERLLGDIYAHCDPDGTGGQLVAPVLKAASVISIPSSGSTVTKDMPGLTASHELVRWNFNLSTENNPPVNLSWATYDGYFTITNNGGTTSETIKPIFAYPNEVTVSDHSA